MITLSSLTDVWKISFCTLTIQQISSNVISCDVFKRVLKVIARRWLPFKLIVQKKRINNAMCSPCFFDHVTDYFSGVDRVVSEAWVARPPVRECLLDGYVFSVLKCKVRLVLQIVKGYFLRSSFWISDDHVKVGNFGKNIWENLIL